MRIIAPRMTGEGQASQGFTDQSGAGIMAAALRNEPFVLSIDDEQLHTLTSLGLRVTLVRHGIDEFRLQVEKFKADLNCDDDDYDDDLFDDSFWDEDDLDDFEDDYDPFLDDFTI